MANKKIWLGILAVALAFGMAVGGCNGTTGGGGGGGDGGSGSGKGCPAVTSRCNSLLTCKAGNCGKDYCNSYGCMCVDK